MKINYLLSCVLLLLFVSCKKDNQKSGSEITDGTVLVNAITERLASADSVSIFISGLKSVTLTEEEAAQGITVFVPLNQDGIATGQVNSKNKYILLESPVIPPVSENVVKYHIVKGIHKLSDLTDGRILKNISGQELIVNRSPDGKTIFLNGVQVSGDEVLQTDKTIVYIVKEYLHVPDESILKPIEYTEESYSLVLQGIENDINLWHKNLVSLDGVLSHDIEVNELPIAFRNKFRWFGNFSFNSSDALVRQYWTLGYNCIGKLNNLERWVNEYTTDNKHEEKIARLKGLKAYVYLHLLNYYGNIVVSPETHSVYDEISNTDREAVVNYIEGELNFSILKFGNPSHSGDLNTTALKVLKARLALLEKKYEIAKNLTQEILSQEQYSLEQPQSIFNTGSKEIIWNNSDNIDANITSYFYDRNILPYIRLTEVYLMNAEANYRLGNTIQAKESFDAVVLRSGKTLTFSWENLQQLWLEEMSREGTSFIALVRWGTAAEKLGQYGFSAPKNNLLPIPIYELLVNRYLVQNPKY